MISKNIDSPKMLAPQNNQKQHIKMIKFINISMFFVYIKLSRDSDKITKKL